MPRELATSKILILQHERKGFLHGIFTIDETWIYFENSKPKKLVPDMALTWPVQQNRFCAWWDQKVL